MTTLTDLYRIQIGAWLTNAAHSGGPLPTGWTEYAPSTLDKYLNSGSGYQAKVFVNSFTKEIFVGNAGTNDGKDVANWPTVLTGGGSSQIRDSLGLGKRIDDLVKGNITEDLSLQGYTVTASAYSWGGAPGQVQASTFGWKYVGYDAVGGGAIVNGADYQNLVSELGINPVGKAADSISCRVAGWGPFGGSGVELMGSDIDGTRTCTMELANSAISGGLSALYTFATSNTPWGFLVKSLGSKLASTVALHDIDNINDAVQAGKFKLDGVDQTPVEPAYQPFSFTDDEGNILRTKLDAQGNVLLGADNKPLLELTLNDSANSKVVEVSMGCDGKPDACSWNTPTQGGTSIYEDGVRTDVVTDKGTGQTSISAVDENTGKEIKTGGGSMGLTPAAYQQLIYSDMAGFLSALRNGDKLNQALYGVKLTLDVMLSQGKTLDQSMAGLRDGLDAVAGAVGVVAALHALQSDDTLTQMNGVVGLLSSSNQLFAAMNGGAIGEGLTTNGFLNKGDLAALQVVSSFIALSNLKNLDNMLDNGQVGSAGATVYQAVKAVQFLAAAAETGSLSAAAASTAVDPMTAVIIIVTAWALDEIFAEDAPPPPPKPPAGWAEFKLVNDSLSWVFHDKMADGQGFGYADTVMGKTILNEKMSKLISTLKTQLEQANRGSTDTDRELCVVASRIPKVYLQSWLVGADETNGKDNYHFLLESTHAQTGEKTYQPIARQDIDKDFSYSQSCAFTRRRTHKQNRHHTTQGAQHASLEQ